MSTFFQILLCHKKDGMLFIPSLLQQVQFVSSTFKRLTKLWRSDGVQAARSLGEVTTMQFGNAVFCNHIMNVRTRGGNGCSRRQDRYDTRDNAIGRFEQTKNIIRRVSSPLAAIGQGRVCGGRQCDDRPSPLCQGCTTHKIHLPSNATIKVCTDRFGAYLTGEIYLYSTIYRHHMLKLANDRRAIRVIAGAHLNSRIIMNKVEQTTAARDKTGNDFVAGS